MRVKWFCVIATLIWFSCIGAALASLTANHRPDEPRFQSTRQAVTVGNWSDQQWNVIRQLAEQDRQDELLQVFVSGNKTPLLGTVSVVDQQLVFTPRFPFGTGVAFKARLAFDRIEPQSRRKPILHDFTFEPSPTGEATQLVAMYPTANRVPQNILKMYLQFSQPMSRGEAYDRIRFVDDQGRLIPEPFIRIQPELWSPDGRRFTLLFDPGRIKRELRPNRELGPPFKSETKYRVVIDAAWRDARGQPLGKEFEKSFATAAPDRQQPAVARWIVAAPAADSRERLEVTFDETLDRGMLDHALRVLDASGNRVAGRPRVLDDELGWEFVPAHPWPAGDYRLIADPRLEDLAGNSLAKPFETELGSSAASRKPGDELRFEVK